MNLVRGVVRGAATSTTRGQACLLDDAARYHPLFVEGMGAYDDREPVEVADAVCTRLAVHWRERPPRVGLDRVALVVQGDPLAERGVSAVTRLVAKRLGLPRVLVCLDESIDDSHALHADREGVVLEYRYTQFSRVLDDADALAGLRAAVARGIDERNEARALLGKPPLADYYPTYAMLQEVSKGALQRVCGGITLAHTYANIHPFSVTSFYTTGLAEDLYNTADVVPF